MANFDLPELRKLDREHHLHPFTDHKAMHGAGTHVIRSAKGSTFYLCELARSDPRFAKYPPQPVLACAGYERYPSSAHGPDG